MGQRSQIYVRFDNKLVLARYYQWNFGGEMISRARHGIEYIKLRLNNGYDLVLRDPAYIKIVSRIFDVDFDKQDVEISADIFKEWEEFGDQFDSFYDFVFAKQDNNDGQLFIDIVRDTENSRYKIKYAFFDPYDGYKNVMDAEAYMDWDFQTCIYKDWRIPNEYHDEEEIETWKKNIKAIEEMAELMSQSDVNSFIQTEAYFGEPETF